MSRNMQLGDVFYVLVAIVRVAATAHGDEGEKVNITLEVRELNSDKFAAPPTKFKRGTVTAYTLDSKSIKSTDAGFTIQLPNSTPIPTPTVYEGRLYVSGGFHSKQFFCFRADTAQPVWGIDLDDDGPTSAVCEDGVTVFNTESCTIFAVDAQTGKLLWSYWLGDPLTSTPTIARGRVFSSYPIAGRGGNGQQLNAPDQSQQAPAQPNPKPASGKSGKTTRKPVAAKPQPPNASHVLACFELRTGKILWQRWLDSDVMSAPIAVDDELYVTSFAGTVYRFKQVDGAILSAQRSRATSAPVVVDGTVYLTKRADENGTVGEAITGQDRATAQPRFAGSRKEAKYLDPTVQSSSSLKGHSMALDGSNGFGGGAPKAANAGAGFGNVGQDNVSSLQAFQGSRILHCPSGNVSCMGDELVCTDASDGTKRWSVKLKGDLEKEGGFLGSSPAAAGGQIFLATLKGEVLQVDPANGKVQKTYPVGSPIRFQPAIDSGRIYVGTQDGKVVCLNTGDLRFTGWCMWGGNAAHSGVAAMPK